MYNPFELSVYAAFDSVLSLEDRIQIGAEKNDHYFSGNKKIDEMKILEQKIETICLQQDYSEDYYPIIFGFARGVTRVFYNTPVKSRSLIDDVVNMRTHSDVLAEMKKEQMLFVKQSQEFLQYSKKHMLATNFNTFFDTERRMRLASNVFTTWRPQTMTPDEHKGLETLGLQADKVKRPPTPYLLGYVA